MTQLGRLSFVKARDVWPHEAHDFTSLMWEELDGRKSTRVSTYSDVFLDVAQIDQWPAMVDWLLDQQLRLRRGLNAVGGAPNV